MAESGSKKTTSELSILKLPKLDSIIKNDMREFLEIHDEVAKVSEMVKYPRKRLKELHDKIVQWMVDHKCEAIPLSNGITFRVTNSKSRKALTKDNHRDFIRDKFNITDTAKLDKLVLELYEMRVETEKSKIKLG